MIRAVNSICQWTRFPKETFLSKSGSRTTEASSDLNPYFHYFLWAFFRFESGCKDKTFFDFCKKKNKLFFRALFRCPSFWKRMQTYNLFLNPNKETLKIFSENFSAFRLCSCSAHNSRLKAFCCFWKRMQIYALFLIVQHHKGDFSPEFHEKILNAAQVAELGGFALKILTVFDVHSEGRQMENVKGFPQIAQNFANRGADLPKTFLYII